MVGLIVAAYFALRATQEGGWRSAAAAGLAAGYALAIKPSNSIFLVVPVLLLLASRWRQLLPFAAGLAPALLTLAIWKYRGLGELAAAPTESIRLVGGVDDLLNRIHQRDLNSLDHLRQVADGLREHFWASRVIIWLPVAGSIGLLLRSWRGLLLAGTWFGVYLAVKGTYILASLDDATFFRLLMPAYPAYVILAASVLLLVPGLRPRPSVASPLLSSRRLTMSVVAAAAVFAVVPLGVIAAVPPLHDSGTRTVQVGISLLPVLNEVEPHVTASGDSVRLTWRAQPTRGGKVFYRVLRGRGDDVACGGRLNNAADDCRAFADDVGSTRGTEFVDHPGRGIWTYHVGVAANWLNDPKLGDIYVVSQPVSISVP
jgi:hypothetical protein